MVKYSDLEQRLADREVILLDAVSRAVALLPSLGACACISLCPSGGQNSL